MSYLCGRWMDKDLLDMQGTPFKVGDLVARACISGRSANLEVSRVTRIDGGRLYLDESKVAINFPGRLLIVTPLFEEVISETEKGN